jgi:hypothetical protein
MIREWPDPEDLYHESVRGLIDMIQSLQETIVDLDNEIESLILALDYWRSDQ